MRPPTPTLGLAGWTLAAGLAMGALGGWRVTTWASQGHELKAVRTALFAERSAFQKNLDELQSQIKTNQEASLGYQNELAALHARPVSAEPVRLCRSAVRARVSEAAPAESGSDAAPAGAGSLQPQGQGDLEAGPDIGGDLQALFLEADELLAQCRGLQRAR